MGPTTMTTPSLKSFAAGLLALGLCAAAGGSALAAGHGSTGAATPAAWTPGTLRQALDRLPAGDAVRGRKVHERLFCASCHGDKGVAPTLNWPHLAGQKAAYTAKMLLDYQSGLRREGRRAELMHDIAAMMTAQQIADVSAYYAAQPAPRDDGTPRPQVQPGPKDMDARLLVRKGDPARLITPCASCHGVVGQGGNREAPALAGQNPLYFVRTMLDYQSDLRHNDSAKGMRVFAHKLTRGEIEALARYYADLPAR